MCPCQCVKPVLSKQGLSNGYATLPVLAVRVSLTPRAPGAPFEQSKSWNRPRPPNRSSAPAQQVEMHAPMLLAAAVLRVTSPAWVRLVLARRKRERSRGSGTGEVSATE